MMASDTRWWVSPPMLAPRSMTTESPRLVGHMPAMAGRSTPGSVRRWKRDIAISAPVFPAETATSASPFFTASMASHMDEVLRPRRSAWLGFSSPLTATSVWMIFEAAFSAGWRSSSGSILARSPISRNSISRCLWSEMAAPGMTTAAPASPPMASSAMRTLLGIKVLETWVWCGLERAGPQMGSPRTWRSVKRHAAPGPGRDNSVLLSRNNLLPPAFCIREHRAADGLIHKKHIKIKQIIRPIKPRSQTPRAPQQGGPMERRDLLVFLLVLECLQDRKGMVLRIGGGDLGLKHDPRLPRIGVDRQEQGIGGEPAKVDSAIDDRLRRVGDLLLIVVPLLHQLGQAADLGLRGKYQVHLLVDVALHRVKRDHTGLADPGADVPRDLDPVAAFRHDIEIRLDRDNLAQACHLGHSLPLGGRGLELAMQAGIRDLCNDDRHPPGIGPGCCYWSGHGVISSGSAGGNLKNAPSSAASPARASSASAALA